MGQVPFTFVLRAKLAIWWRTGFPYSFGIAPAGALGEIAGIGELDGAFIGKTIWINEAVFELERGLEVADWVITHEILHAKIRILRLGDNNWIGRHRLNILHHAADDALALVLHHPDLTEIATALDQYDSCGYDVGEEGLVRIVQLILDDYDLPQSRALRKAAKLLGRPWGWRPTQILRIVLSLPICVWTLRSPYSS